MLKRQLYKIMACNDVRIKMLNSKLASTIEYKYTVQQRIEYKDELSSDQI